MDRRYYFAGYYTIPEETQTIIASIDPKLRRVHTFTHQGEPYIHILSVDDSELDLKEADSGLVALCMIREKAGRSSAPTCTP